MRKKVVGKELYEEKEKRNRKIEKRKNLYKKKARIYKKNQHIIKYCIRMFTEYT